MLRGEKSLWKSKPTPPGPRGLHPAGALVRTHRNHQVQNTIPTGAVANQVSSKPQESARTPPEARGLLSDTTRRGTLSKNKKCCLNLVKIKAKRLPPGLCRILRFARGLAPRPHTKAKSAPPRPSRRGLAPKGLDGMPILRFARGRARQTYSWPPSRPNSSDKTSRPD